MLTGKATAGRCRNFIKRQAAKATIFAVAVTSRERMAIKTGNYVMLANGRVISVEEWY
jgi:hypothetical protein